MGATDDTAKLKASVAGLQTDDGRRTMTEQYKGYTIRLECDAYADNPLDCTTPTDRRAWFALQHRRYNVPFEIEADTDDYSSWAELAKAVTAPDGELAGKVYQFVRWYEHSGVAVSLVDSDQVGGWDSGCAGVIFGDTLDTIKTSFAGWQAYTEGEVYRVRIIAPDGNEVDQLVGLYGYDEAMGCARWVIDADAILTGVERIRLYGRGHAPRARELHA